MRILLIGSGGREHALAWKIAKSPKCEKLYASPGSDGMSGIAESVNIKADDINALLNFARTNKIDLTVVGPEAPLVAGIADLFQKAGLKIFGPTKELARLEGSKVFAKELMKKLGVPTADFKIFDKYEDALDYLTAKGAPVVIKADGLAAGKGVMVCKTIADAKAALKTIMVDRAFGSSGDKVIIEDCLAGEEASIIVVSDGNNVAALASSQDHKRVFDGDKGPNTGGMGAYSPAPIITDDLFKKIMDTVINPVISYLAREGKPYKGALYAGIMITDKGPYALEFNVRFGDPETQAIMPRLKSDLVELIERAVDGNLGSYKLEWDPRPCVSVVAVSGGYPGDYAKGMEIKGLDQVSGMKDIVVFHAGTKLGKRATDGKSLFITTGGRVLNITALGGDYESAIGRCYEAVRTVHFDRMHYRTDIASKAVRIRR
ncbi:MAG: phosphoribosylamine--glycine ligase [Candidatus Omnitrophica bacterium]|nr:phosphoribosylamine--glycine ligase [Candidatus Omnitrophota bacterium]